MPFLSSVTLLLKENLPFTITIIVCIITILLFSHPHLKSLCENKKCETQDETPKAEIKKKKNKKKKEINITQSHIMSFGVCILVITMILLVIQVGCIIGKEYKGRLSIIDSYKELLSSVTPPKVVSGEPAQSDRINSTIVLNTGNLKQLEQVSENLAESIDKLNSNENGFNSILLAMITLCATLAVVIPYVVGKAITHQDVLEVVKTEAEKNQTSFDEKIQKTIKTLEWSEGHNSRMVSYFLQQMKGTKEYKPEWVIGWASKALIRYFKQDQIRTDTKKFCNECIDYISKATDNINSQESIDMDIMYRTIKDAYDVIGFYNKAAIVIDEIQINILKASISSILNKAVKTQYSNKSGSTYNNWEKSITSVLDEVAERSKFKEYLGKNIDKEDFKSNLRNQFNINEDSFKNRA